MVLFFRCFFNCTASFRIAYAIIKSMHSFLRLLFGAFLFVTLAPAFTSSSDASTAADIPLIELYPFPVWYQRFEAGDLKASEEPTDRLIVLDPLSGRVSRFENLHFAAYPAFHVESLGGVLHLRLEGRDDRQVAFKRWYMNPITGAPSEVLSPTGEAQSDQILQCDGQQRQHWVAMGDREAEGNGVALFDARQMKALTDWETPTARFPLPQGRLPWRTCHHQNWVLAYQRDALYVYHAAEQKRFTQALPEGVVAEPLNVVFRDQKVWVWWRMQNQLTAAVTFVLWHFDFENRAWQIYPSQPLPFLPLQDFASHELLLGPPWLPSDYRAPYFRLNTLTGKLSAPIWVTNEAPGQIGQRAEVWQQLTGPIPE